MTRIVSPSALAELLTEYFDTLEKSSERAADVASAIGWLQSFEAINLDRLAKYVTGGEDFALSLPDLATMVRDRVLDDYPAKPIRIKTTDGFGNVAYISKTGDHWNLTSVKGVPLAMSNLFNDEPALRFALDDAKTPGEALEACQRYNNYCKTVELA